MMDAMRAEPLTRRGPFWSAMAMVSALALSSCSDSKAPVAEAAEPTPTSTTTAPSTTPTSTTTTSTTTLAPTTSTTTTSTTTTSTTTTSTTTTSTSTTSTTTSSTSTPTTSTTTLPVESDPIDVPTDLYSSEPVIEVGSIEIPKIGVDMTMYEGIRMTTLDHGPGHWPGTAMPGEVGNVVVAGHRTSKHRVFRNVDQLVAGDQIIFRDGNGTHTYSVREVEIVPPTAVWIVNPTETPTATLFACHPPGSTAQRIVVFADLVT
jgi:sortase A